MRFSHTKVQLMSLRACKLKPQEQQTHRPVLADPVKPQSDQSVDPPKPEASAKPQILDRPEQRQNIPGQFKTHTHSHTTQHPQLPNPATKTNTTNILTVYLPR